MQLDQHYKQRAIKLNEDENLPVRNSRNALIVIGCNYHTTWAKSRQMRFVLTEVQGDQARLQTRNSKKDFWTDLHSLIFIGTIHNTIKAKELRPDVDIRTRKKTH